MMAAIVFGFLGMACSGVSGGFAAMAEQHGKPYGFLASISGIISGALIVIGIWVRHA